MTKGESAAYGPTESGPGKKKRTTCYGEPLNPFTRWKMP